MKNGETTQFSMAAQFGSIGLLAHNNLSGRSFSKLELGQEVRLVYGGGKVEYFVITEILQYQALQPTSQWSEFRDLAGADNKTITAEQLLNIATVVNTDFINQEDVTNSAEIEQEAQQVNEECEIFVACVNTIVAQTQTLNSATVVNTLFVNQEDVSNSAEVEQEIEQVNDQCDTFATCENTIVAQTQALNSATVVNTLFVNQEDVTNSAEIEQEAEQENFSCDIFTLCDNTIVAQTQAVNPAYHINLPSK